LVEVRHQFYFKKKIDSIRYTEDERGEREQKAKGGVATSCVTAKGLILFFTQTFLRQKSTISLFSSFHSNDDTFFLNAVGGGGIQARHPKKNIQGNNT
jgi:hypothetical protein